MDFEAIKFIRKNDPSTTYKSIHFLILREVTTDVLWIKYNDDPILEMHDPETGLPLTYKIWKEKYQNEK